MEVQVSIERALADDVKRWAASPGRLDQAVKRTLDIFGAVVGLILGLPILALAWASIRLDSPGPALFRQPRLGRDGRPFELLKFRTMYENAEDLLSERLRQDPSSRLSWEQYQKLWDDPRITRVGGFMRRWSLDELPQLWNVLRGDMSLVGPRPILPEQREAYGPAYASYVRLRPGLTGAWQVGGRNRLSFEDRARYDEEYARERCFRADVRILWLTVGAVFRQDGAY